VDYPAEKAIYQDASGNTYVPSLGGTTPSTGTFTTITGQTETLKGTGENLTIQSQNLTATGWGNTNLTINATATTAPDGTTTGNSLIPTTLSSIHRVGITNSVISGITYTISVYAKANGYNYLYFNCNNFIGAYTTFNISNGTISTIGGGTATITSAPNGWYRCTITGTTPLTQTGTLFLQVNNTQTGALDDTFAGNGTSGIYVWGVQTEVGPVANTYVPTTSTIVYGYPSLSFSGSGLIELQQDGSMVVQPAGTGALQAQQTTSTATGGNARGANAVDWQTARDTAAKVASGAQSVVGGGIYNQASGAQSVVGGGSGNISSSNNSVILGGYQNINSGNQAAIVAGYNNTSSGSWSAILGGYVNTAAGFLNFIGGGFANSGTSGSAVTTQATSAITSGSTAVTLSGSNASIKVGQLITGTPVASYPATYVAAISGTSLTLSQNATSSTNATLSFYTPHGVVVGGGNNQATGAYSFIGGGGDAGTAANRNVASGDWSFVGGGQGNTNAGAGAVIIGGGYTGSGVSGNSITSSGTYAAILGGKGNTNASIGGVVLGADNNASGFAGSSILGGRFNQSNAIYSTVLGGANATNRGINGHFAFGIGATTGSNGQFQSSLLNLYIQTTTTGATALTSDLSSATTTNQMVLPNGQTGTVSVYTFRVLISAHNSANTTDIAGWQILGVISRGNGVGTTALVGTPTVTLLGATTGAISAGWGTVSNVAAVADTTNGALQIQVTGVASTTIRWSARVETNELAY